MNKKNVVTVAFVICLTLCILLVMMYFIGKSIDNGQVPVDFENLELIQLDTIELNIEDEAKVAVIETSEGKIMAELYTDIAPNTTGNFISLAESGYYDGTYIYEVARSADEETNTESKLYFSGGSPYNDGSLKDGYDKKSEKIDTEFHQNLWPFRGSFLSCGLSRKSYFANKTIIFGGSRFMVCGSIEFTDEIQETLRQDEEALRVTNAFIEYGGVPNASQMLTVFAQTFYGWDTVEKILDAETAEKVSKPLNDIIIEKVSICTYADVKQEVESAAPEKKFTFKQSK